MSAKRTSASKDAKPKAGEFPRTNGKPLPLDLIRDGGAQMRVELRPETVNEYATELLNGTIFPPVVVFFDGESYWLADGFHRVAAARKADHETIGADIRDGGARDAILHGIGANAAHGLRRTNQDKRRAVERLLGDAEWAQLSDRKIAELARVDHKTVSAIRRELAGEFPTGNGKPKSGEFPTINGKRKERGSLIDDLLRSVADENLIAECKRRGLRVELSQ